MPTEKSLQDYVCKKLRTGGMLVYKFASPSQRGVPDLLCVPQDRPIFMIEVKSPTGRGRLSKLQQLQITKLRNQGVHVHVIDSRESADFITQRELEKR